MVIIVMSAATLNQKKVVLVVITSTTGINATAVMVISCSLVELYICFFLSHRNFLKNSNHKSVYDQYSMISS